MPIRKKLFASATVDPRQVIAETGPGDPGRAVGTASAGEVLVAILVALTSTKILDRSAPRLRRLLGRLEQASRAFSDHLDPDGAIRMARSLAVSAAQAGHASTPAAYARAARFPRWLKPATRLTVIGLEAVFLATFVFNWIEQGTSWLSAEGMVSLLLGITHPLVVLFIGAVLMDTASRPPLGRQGRLKVLGVLALLLADLIVVYTLSGFIVGAAVEYAVSNGATEAEGFPTWAIQLLFTGLPVALVVLDWVDADPVLAQHRHVAAAGRRAANRRAQMVKTAHRRAAALDRAWLALFALVVRVARGLTQATFAGEFAVTQGRADRQGPGVPVQPDDRAPNPATEAAALLETLIADLRGYTRHLRLDHQGRTVLADLGLAIAVLLNTPRPTPAILQAKIRNELGGPAAVGDPAEWEPFNPEGATAPQPEPGPAVPPAPPIVAVPERDDPEDEEDVA